MSLPIVIFIHRRAATSLEGVLASNPLPPPPQNKTYLGAQNCVFYFDMDDATGTFEWTTPHVLFESRSVVDFSTDPKTGGRFCNICVNVVVNRV